MQAVMHLKIIEYRAIIKLYINKTERGMGRKERLCLEKRNSHGNYEETESFHYVKSKGVYLRRVFFSHKAVFLFFVCAVMAVALFFIKDDPNDKLVRLIPFILAVVFGFSWLFLIFYGLWYWKYTKHVFVTNNGIWVMTCSVFWWSKDFTGKKRFLSPSWSLYGWNEIAVLPETEYADGGRGISRIYDFFEDFDKFVTRSANHSAIYLKRFDGVEEVEFLKNNDVKEILEYAKAHKKSRSKKTKAESAEEQI